LTKNIFNDIYESEKEDKMNIKRTFTCHRDKNGPYARCYLRAVSDGSCSMQELMDLFEEAKKDFPLLDPNKVVVYHDHRNIDSPLPWRFSFEIVIGKIEQVPKSYKDVSPRKD
jgi:hypothetical protein